MDHPKLSASSSRIKPLRIGLVFCFFILQAVQAIILFLAVLVDRSMDSRAVLLGYSWVRLVLVVYSFSMIFIWLFLIVRSISNSEWIEGKIYLTDQWVSKNALVFLFFLYGSLYLALFGLYIVVLIRSASVPEPPYFLTAIIRRSFPIMVWSIIFLVESFLLLLLEYWNTVKSSGPSAFLLFLVLSLSTFQWLTLLLQAQWLFKIKGWYWAFHPKHLQIEYLFLPLIWTLGLFCIDFVLKKSNQKHWNLAIPIILFYLLMISFGFAEGHGLDSIRSDYFRSKGSDIARISCEANIDVIMGIKNYDSVFGNEFWLGTKPPGLISFYLIIRDFVLKINPQLTKGSNYCLDYLSRLFVIMIPILFSLILIPIYFLSKALKQNSNSFNGSFLFITAPSILLMMLLSDQFLYPFIFILTVLLLSLAITRKSFFLGIVSGIAVYLSIFVSFSLLPLIGLIIIWIFLELLVEIKRTHYFERRNLYLIIGIILGFLVTGVFFYLMFAYNPISRYNMAFQSHRDIKHYELSIKNLIQNIFVNNLEFGFWSGLPLFFLFFLASIRSIALFLKNKASRFDLFVVAFLSMYLILNIIGQTSGEVGRIWIFLLPVIALISASESGRLLKNPTRSIQLVFLLQLVTAALMFFFWDNFW